MQAKTADPAAALRQIDVHGLSVDEVYTRFSTSPTLGLENDAIERRSKAGKNVISSPPTQYWKKGLNYVFGGFNFLMWIAFIVTVVRAPDSFSSQSFTAARSYRMSLWVLPIPPPSTSALPFYWCV